MTKRSRKDFRGKANKKTRSENGAPVDNRVDKFGEWVYDNENFVKYYKAQNILSEAEWAEFMKSLATPLPTTFRINNSCPFAEKIRERIAVDFKFDGLVVDDEEVAPIGNMPWYPNQKGFQWSVERRRVRKLPILAEFQKWLVELSNSGSITRQEAVSMIPPLILDVEPKHKVLDMCAAPGSKTSQLLESLHAQEQQTGKAPTGMVVANDIDIKRAYMLVHQSKRIGSPALVVTCHEAQKIPFLGKSEEDKAQGFFDRVLCDAPCSGDGTLRKNPIIWKHWDAKNGMALHPVQLQVSKRGASLLKVGGYMCYSTCTFNPLENEAIVADMLRWSQGSLELVDVADRLPLLKRRPGISTWKVLDSSLTEYKSMEEVETTLEQDKEARKKQLWKMGKISASMFPPTAEEASRFNLERCMRCVPQDENTGGFFICLFKKVAPTPEEVEEPKPSAKKDKSAKDDVKAEEAKVDDVKAEDAKVGEATTEESAVAEAAVEDEADKPSAEEMTVAAENASKRPRREDRRRNNTSKGEEYVAFPAEDWKQLQSHYDIDASFSPAQLITRSDDAKSVTFVTKSITMDLLNDMKAKKYKVVYAGLKMFERNETTNGGRVYRLCQASIHHILPFMGLRKAKVSAKELQMMLERVGDLLDFDEFEPATQKTLEDTPIGSIVCSLDQPNQSMVEKMVLNVVIWRGRNSVNVMTAKADVVVVLSAMKELNLYDAQVREQVLAVKERKDAERAKRDQLGEIDNDAKNLGATQQAQLERTTKKERPPAPRALGWAVAHSRLLLPAASRSKNMVVRKRNRTPATQVSAPALDRLAVVSTEQLQTSATPGQREESDGGESSGADSHEDSYGGIGRKPIRSWSKARFTSDEVIASSLAGLRESDDDEAYRSSKRRRVRFEANGSQDPSLFVPHCRAEQEGHAISQYLQQTMHQVARLNLELTSLAPMIYSSGFLTCGQSHGVAGPQPSDQDGSSSDQEIVVEAQRINATLETLLRRMLVPLATASPQSFPSRSQSSTNAQPLLHQVHAQLVILEAHLRGSVSFDQFVVRMRPILESLWITCRADAEEAQRQKRMLWKSKAEDIYKRLKSALLDSNGNSSMTKQLLDVMEDADKLVFNLERCDDIDDKAAREQPMVNAIAALRSAFYEMEARRWSSQEAANMESTQSPTAPDNDIDRSGSSVATSGMGSQHSVQTPMAASAARTDKQVARGPKKAQGKMQRKMNDLPLPQSVRRKNSKPQHQVTAAAPTKSASAHSAQIDNRTRTIRPAKTTEAYVGAKAMRKSTLSMGALAARDATKSPNAPPVKSSYATRGRSAVVTPKSPRVRGGRSTDGSAESTAENQSANNGQDRDGQGDRDSIVLAATAAGNSAQDQLRTDSSAAVSGKERQSQVTPLGGEQATPSNLVFSVPPKNREIRPRVETPLTDQTIAEKPTMGFSARATTVESASSTDVNSGGRADSTAKRAPPQYFPAVNPDPKQVMLPKVISGAREPSSVLTASAASPLLPMGWPDIATSTDDDSEPKENEASATNTKSESSRRRGRFAGCAVCLKNNLYHALLLCDNECGREYHTFCLDPKLDKIPEGEWYCPECIKVEGVKDHQIFKCSALNCWKITGAKYCSLHRCRHSNCLNRLKAAGFCRRHEAHRAQPKKVRPRTVSDPAQSENLKDEELSRTELVPRVDLRSDGRLAGTAS